MVGSSIAGCVQHALLLAVSSACIMLRSGSVGCFAWLAMMLCSKEPPVHSCLVWQCHMHGHWETYQLCQVTLVNRPSMLCCLQDAATLGPSCTTAGDGTCTLTVIDSGSQVKSAVVTASGQGPLIVPALASVYGGSSADVKYSGALVLDRQVVKPGDDLHITGGSGFTVYISRICGYKFAEIFAGVVPSLCNFTD